MKFFKQNDEGLLGSLEDIEKLSRMDEASILVLSDSHKNPENIECILNSFGQTCDALVFCGDGAYDLADCLNKEYKRSGNQNKIIPPVAAFVRGNGDPSHVVVDFDPVPDILLPPKNAHTQNINYHLRFPDVTVLEAAGKRILISHGHLQSIDYNESVFQFSAKENNCSVILHGHTHIATQKYLNDGTHLICPGSVSLPRGGQEKSFCILTIKGNYVSGAFMEITPSGFRSYTPPSW